MKLFDLLNTFIGDSATLHRHLHHRAADLLDEGWVAEAWKLLLPA